MGLANRVVAPGTARAEAEALARQISSFPQACMRSDRRSAYEQWDMSFDKAIVNEYDYGYEVVKSGETLTGATRFAQGAGRHGAFDD